MSTFILKPCSNASSFVNGCSHCPDDMCEQCLCDTTVAGDDNGYSRIFYRDPYWGNSISLAIDFESYTIKDQLTIEYSLDYTNWTSLYDTGCQAGYSYAERTPSSSFVALRVIVTPHCEGGTGTLWEFTITCF